MAIPITKNLLTVVTSSLERLIVHSLASDHCLARDSYIVTDNLSSPPYPQPPCNTPTLPKICYKSYRPHDITAFKKSLCMSPTITSISPEEPSGPSTVQLTSTSSQQQEEDTFDWQFNGPIIEGPLSNAQTMEVNLHKVFHAAGLKVYKAMLIVSE